MLKIGLAETAADRNHCYLLRIEVFVREQRVPMSEELDDRDETDALHFLGTEDGVPVATARVLVGQDVAKIQRVAVLRECRGKGYGKDLMRAIIDHFKDAQFSGSMILDSQTHAIGFYRDLGFVEEGAVFDDAGIPHKRMQRIL